MRKSKLMVSMLIIAISASLIGGATMAALSDKETSDGNTFAAGTLDLKLDGGDSNVTFSASNMKPGDQPKKTYDLNNVGSLNGYLDISNISVVNTENGITEPEAEAGDVTDAVGELGNVVNIRLFIDRDGDGWIGTGDTVFYNGKVSNLPSSFNLNELIVAGGNTSVTAILDWWDTADDNKAQNDSMDINLSFNLNQRNE